MRIYAMILSALFFVACSTNQPQYVDSRDFVTFGLDNHDIGDVLQKQVDSLLNHPTIKKQNEPKVLTIGAIENKTNDNIDIEIISNELTRHLSNSGKFVIVNAGRDKKIEQIITDSRTLRQNAEYNQYTTIEQGNLIAPHYALTGTITQRNKRIIDDEINEYVFSFTLTDLQLGAVRWVGSEQISKKLPKKEVAKFAESKFAESHKSADSTNRTNPAESPTKSNDKSKNHFIFGFDFSLLNVGFVDIGTIRTNANGKNYAIIATHKKADGGEFNPTYPLNFRIGYLRDLGEHFGIALNALYHFTYKKAGKEHFTLENVTDYHRREYMSDLDISGEFLAQFVSLVIFTRYFGTKFRSGVPISSISLISRQNNASTTAITSIVASLRSQILRIVICCRKLF
ncbi:penicillin-binding protein activator LpoB [Helicobacter sp. 23-1044]